MARRQQIMEGMGVSGGTTAARRNQIKGILNDPRRAPGPGKLPPRRYPNTIAPLPGSPQDRPSGAPSPRPRGPGIGQSNQAQLGQQLTNRVNSGRISQEQAEKTAQQRQTLKKAFGSDWRSQVYAGSGVKEIREGGPFANRQVAAERAKGLERAKRKLRGGVGPGMAA